MNKVVCICHVPLTASIKKFLMLQELIDAGLNVEFWDLSTIYFRNFHFKNVLSDSYIIRINSIGDFKIRVKAESLNKTIFVTQVFFDWQVLDLYFILTWFKCKMVYFAVENQEPSQGTVVKIFDKIRRSLLSGSCLKVPLKLFARFCKKVGLVKEYDLVFAAGQLTHDAFRNRCKVVNINYLDYDRFLLSKPGTSRIVPDDYCVFLDEGTIRNEDVKILKLAQMDSEKHFGSLNSFFDGLEKKFAFKVVIAAHPGIFYDKKVFDGREIYEGKTCELVKDCKFVISQSSLAVSFAVLYNKPVVFIYTSEYTIKRKGNFEAIKYYSNVLNVDSLNINSTDILDKLLIPKVDLDAYNNYKYTFLTSHETEDKRSKDILIENLKSF